MMDNYTKVISIFNVWKYIYRKKRGTRYPCYDIPSCLVGSAFNLESAQRIVQEVISENKEWPGWAHELHHLRIVEVPEGKMINFNEVRPEYVFGPDGQPLEFCPSSGDLCEVADDFNCGESWLGIVVKTPEKNGGYYEILFGEDLDTFSIEASHVLPPMAHVPARTELRLRRAYAEKSDS